MKKSSSKFLAAIFVSVLLSSCAVMVRTPVPVARVVVRPAAPGHRHIWISDEYVFRGGRYVLIPGYWAAPGSRQHSYVAGHWKITRRGNRWIPGRWR